MGRGVNWVIRQRNRNPLWDKAEISCLINWGVRQRVVVIVIQTMVKDGEMWASPW